MTRNSFEPPRPKTIGATFEQLGAEFERQRAIRRRQLMRSAIAALIAMAIFAFYAGVAGLDTWFGRVNMALSVLAGFLAFRALARRWRT